MIAELYPDTLISISRSHRLNGVSNGSIRQNLYCWSRAKTKAQIATHGYLCCGVLYLLITRSN